MWAYTEMENDGDIQRWYTWIEEPHIDPYDKPLELAYDKFNAPYTVAHFCLYRYNDEPEIFYLSNLWVEDTFQRERIGSRFIMMAKNDVLYDYGGNEIRLLCYKDDWTHDWYECEGFRDFKDEGKDMVWMSYKRVKI